MLNTVGEVLEDLAEESESFIRHGRRYGYVVVSAELEWDPGSIELRATCAIGARIIA